MLWPGGMPYIHVVDIVESVCESLVCNEKIVTKEVPLPGLALAISK